MGYTHYFRYQTASDGYTAAWPTIVADARTICRAVTDGGVALAGPLGTGDPVVDELDGIMLNGSAERGEAYESLVLCSPHAGPAEYQPWFCKTDLQPYDLAVTAILLRCRLLAPGDFLLASDGTWDEWAIPVHWDLPSTRQLLTDLFGPVPDLDGWDRL